LTEFSFFLQIEELPQVWISERRFFYSFFLGMDMMLSFDPAEMFSKEILFAGTFVHHPL
jgi:hypothetical protein